MADKTNKEIPGNTINSKGETSFSAQFSKYLEEQQKNGVKVLDPTQTNIKKKVANNFSSSPGPHTDLELEIPCDNVPIEFSRPEINVKRSDKRIKSPKKSPKFEKSPRRETKKREKSPRTDKSPRWDKNEKSPSSDKSSKNDKSPAISPKATRSPSASKLSPNVEKSPVFEKSPSISRFDKSPSVDKNLNYSKIEKHSSSKIDKTHKNDEMPVNKIPRLSIPEISLKIEKLNEKLLKSEKRQKKSKKDKSLRMGKSPKHLKSPKHFDAPQNDLKSYENSKIVIEKTIMKLQNKINSLKLKEKKPPPDNDPPKDLNHFIAEPIPTEEYFPNSCIVTKKKKKKRKSSEIDEDKVDLDNSLVFNVQKSAKKIKKSKNMTVTSTSGGSLMSLSNFGQRGRPPKAKQDYTYQSEITDTPQGGIKLCIKKASLIPPQPPTPTPVQKRTRKRKKQRSRSSDSETSIDHDILGGSSSSKTKGKRKTNVQKSFSNITVSETPSDDQTDWGNGKMPPQVLKRIFNFLNDGPSFVATLLRLSKVCRFWRSVSLEPELWTKVDLGHWCKERHKNDYRLIWLIENRLSECVDLNLSNWKITNLSYLVDIITDRCKQLRGINLCGWNGLNANHLKDISTKCEQLQKLDLSSINSDTTITKCAIGQQPLVQLAQDMSDRLTHLVLANNKLTGFPQMIQAIATHCSNLQLLDLSNIKTLSHTMSYLHVERLQEGCQKLRVLRIANSQIALAPCSVKEQVESPGFPNLEELSVATVNDTTFVDDTAIERILKNSHKLRLLDVRGCSRISDSSLVRVPAWDLEHLFLSGCYVTRYGSGLELIAQKWSHSLFEIDLAWSTCTKALDAAVMALAEKGDESFLRTVNLCGSSVNLEPVKEILKKCQRLNSINLSSCRALPRGIKRLYEGTSQITELRNTLFKPPAVIEDEQQEKPKDKKKCDKTIIAPSTPSSANVSPTTTTASPMMLTSNNEVPSTDDDKEKSILTPQQNEVINDDPIEDTKQTNVLINNNDQSAIDDGTTTTSSMLVNSPYDQLMHCNEVTTSSTICDKNIDFTTVYDTVTTDVINMRNEVTPPTMYDDVRNDVTNVMVTNDVMSMRNEVTPPTMYDQLSPYHQNLVNSSTLVTSDYKYNLSQCMPSDLNSDVLTSYLNDISNNDLVSTSFNDASYNGNYNDLSSVSTTTNPVTSLDHNDIEISDIQSFLHQLTSEACNNSQFSNLLQANSICNSTE